ncbi:putative spermidine/putrescine transport system ATP-binding protein [Plantibacter flavus]|uniref:Spermidine/putrescine import ATP-binding protein PotA n=1 Tax=Plantibacter flavus TaxID=150123 RepID=A0A3N2C7F7_9MICO|nr:ABC transporter ATP-binding protein [Plantibacter flavus]ROR83455.1 putative spermidine/putrescine transport system ATP-binding protein [Plantibacter flavus]SMG23572.1 putative spermidine/putrescine transport system ATP-binding protein [Plantibacter flavus]
MTISRSDTTAPSQETAARQGTQIRLSGVTKDYGLAIPAVDDISLTIQPGEFMTLLGPSGSGKTTTLNLIAGFETLTAGTIDLNGTDVGSLPPHKRNLGMLFQNYALFPHMTVAQNVGYPLRERKLPKAEITRRVAEVLELVQLPGRDGNYPSQLSGGQQQRVALARAIVFNPAALLLDEPLGALDRNLRGALQMEIRRIHREVGSTFVFVTHDQEEAMNLSDRIALFNSGRIEQVGSPEELYHEPDTLFTATFLGDSNVFDLGGSAFGPQAGWEGNTWSIDPTTVADHPGVGVHGAVVVRPEDVRITHDATAVPAGSNTVQAVVRDLEYMGSYRTAMLDLGRSGQLGRARIDALDAAHAIGDTVTAWWKPERQRIVAA